MWILIGAVAVILGIAFLIIGTVAGNISSVNGDTNGWRRSTATKILAILLLLAGAALVAIQVVPVVLPSA